METQTLPAAKRMKLVLATASMLALGVAALHYGGLLPTRTGERTASAANPQEATINPPGQTTPAVQPSQPVEASLGGNGTGAFATQNLAGGALEAIGRVASGQDRSSVLAYAPPMPAGADEGRPAVRATPEIAGRAIPSGLIPVPAVEPPLMLAIDSERTRAIIALYRNGDISRADAATQGISDPLTRLTLEWAGLRLQPRAMGFGRLSAFMEAHPQWPSNSWFENRIEDMLFGDNMKEAAIRDIIARRPPETASGKIAQARLLREREPAKAKALVVDLWRQQDLNTAQERAILKEFGAMLGDSDHRFRASRLLYAEKNVAALRAASEASKDFQALVRLRIAGQSRALTDKEIAKLPKAEQADPGFTFAKVNRLRRAGKYSEAADLLLNAPVKPEEVVDGDAWWTERRIVARQMLDEKQWDKAYRIAANHAATSPEERIDAEFHAGWIALRFLNDGKGDPARAAGHFATAAQVASSPISIARIAYWQGRALEAGGDESGARTHYQRAAHFRTAYYGQLASARLGIDEMQLRATEAPPEGEARHASVRAVELLYAIGAEDLAFPLVVDAARNMTNEAQLGALAKVLYRQKDARASLTLGKLAMQRGYRLDEAAFPVFGVPNFEPAGADSADMALVYAIARQESAFQPAVVSHAGAKGLMQMLPATARATATRAGLPFDERKLTSDPRFNAQLGAAHLGELLGQNRGSYILTFIAYNAGPKRVQEWIERFGDPRDPAVDVIDWIERIPFPETRNYVQRISENLQVYRMRLGQRDRLTIEADLRRSVRQ